MFASGPSASMARSTVFEQTRLGSGSAPSGRTAPGEFFRLAARSAFGLASVAVGCIGCECVAQSPWAEAEAEVDVAGGVVHISVVSHTSCVVRG